MANIVPVTRGSYGDAVPFLAIGAALCVRGHRVTLLTHCGYQAAAARVGVNEQARLRPRRID